MSKSKEKELRKLLVDALFDETNRYSNILKDLIEKKAYELIKDLPVFYHHKKKYVCIDTLELVFSSKEA